MSKLCGVCKTENDAAAVCCEKCGAMLTSEAAAAEASEAITVELPEGSKMTVSREMKLNKKTLTLIGIIVALVVIVVLLMTFILGKSEVKREEVTFDESIAITTAIADEAETTTTAPSMQEIATTSENVTASTQQAVSQEITSSTTATTTTTTTTTAATTTTRATTTATTTTRKAEVETTTALQTGDISINSNLQYDLNLFLSNFSEANLKSYVTRPDDAALINFAYNFNFINNRDRFEVLDTIVEIGDMACNYRISKENVVRSIENYFDITLEDDFGEDYTYYADGYFYYTFTGGMIMDDITIVTRAEYIGNDVYLVFFNLYDVASNNGSMYTYTDSQMLEDMDSKPYIRKSDSGYAQIYAEDINDANTYYLQCYTLY